jgi:hypothetical protein
MRMAYDEFWTCVELGVAPQGDTDEERAGLVVMPDAALDEMLLEYRVATNDRYNGERRQKELKSIILTHLGDRTGIITERCIARVQTVDNGKWAYTKLVVKDRAEKD